MKLKIHEAMELARLRRRHKRYAKARSLYETIVKAQPDNAKALHQPALVARDAGEIAVNYLLRAIDEDKDLLDAYRDLDLVVLVACGSIEDQCRNRVGASVYDQCLEREYGATERAARQYRAMQRYDTQSLPDLP